MKRVSVSDIGEEGAVSTEAVHQVGYVELGQPQRALHAGLSTNPIEIAVAASHGELAWATVSRLTPPRVTGK